MCLNISSGGDAELMKIRIDKMAKTADSISRHVIEWVRKAQVITYN